ncbi:hypothetical protein ABW22_13820 [Thiobacillus denitrificans]|uniref:Uncharacterized protein n=1 Tax=Thiobacillus denitrificans TaxID=36861 RepID=A0A125BBU9_THIDE|nr:hypothetical protein ABW22_13820 [Thiobacillus denitrificans]
MNEALVVVLVFVLGSLVMSYPLGAAGDSWLDGWFEAVSGITTTGLSTAVSTGGFSTFDNSLAGLGPGAAAVIMGFAWLGAVSLPLYTLAWQKGPGVMRRAPELCGR